MDASDIWRGASATTTGTGMLCHPPPAWHMFDENRLTRSSHSRGLLQRQASMQPIPTTNVTRTMCPNLGYPRVKSWGKAGPCRIRRGNDGSLPVSSPLSGNINPLTGSTEGRSLFCTFASSQLRQFERPACGSSPYRSKHE